METYHPATEEAYGVGHQGFIETMKVAIIASFWATMLRLLNLTLRYQYFRMDNREAAAQYHPSGSFCTALWHQNSVASLLAHRGLNIKALVSYNLHGEIIARVLKRFNFDSIHGEPARRGRVALREIYKKVPSGCKVAMTVDGPTGPRHEVKSGIVAVASTKDLQILPVAAVADRYWELRTWDRLRIPKPFAKIRIMYGTPISVNDGEDPGDFEKAKIKVSQALHRIERQMARFRIY